MSLHKLIADVDNRGRAMRVAGALQDLIALPPDALTVFEEKSTRRGEPSWRIEAYFSEARDAEALGAELDLLLGEPAPAFQATDIPDLNWVALSQAALPPVRASRFTVHGSHDRARVPQGPNAILIEAGEAFGTAHHATTYGCLVALGQLGATRRFRRILDLGCGSGVLAIAAARAWPHAAVHGVDIDRQSIVVARENAAVNRVAERISFVCGDGVSAPEIRRAAPFDLIFANILAGPLVALAPDIRRVAVPGAVIVLSGLLTREAARVLAAYLAHGFALLSHRRYDGWSTLTLAKRA
ncbi:50S ribosomal protein L11 methyltransferase [Hyphomicrobium sp.]|uniref:50S ribosomal protein L11 methyltransferase n=1 Tax=Hyphomicrobium sp. TaxID=82 RepID=UPI0025C72391|nr:50S ribosomal protein L11 methyltransferase [Hyphomicrobium sp.]MCC7252860.1 50S ribosomal protein L11 methyltransferase [Hyphomicrobium sp.]